jgi:hypothetical protein
MGPLIFHIFGGLINRGCQFVIDGDAKLGKISSDLKHPR